MSNDFNTGFTEGFKAGWDAAQKQAMNYAPPPENVAFQPPHNWAEHLHRTDRSYMGPQVTPSRPPEPWMNRRDPNNPWTAHSRGRGGLPQEEVDHFHGQLNETGLNLHTTTPEYDVEDKTMPRPTRIL